MQEEEVEVYHVQFVLRTKDIGQKSQAYIKYYQNLHIKECYEGYFLKCPMLQKIRLQNSSITAVHFYNIFNMCSFSEIHSCINHAT